MKHAALVDWLAASGLRNLPLEEMVDGFARRLNDMGVPMARAFVGMNTLHPMVRARSLIWDRATGPATHFEFRHADIDAPIVRLSPFVPMLRDGVGERRRRLDDPAVGPGSAGVRGAACGGHDGVAGSRLSLRRAGAPGRRPARGRALPSDCGSSVLSPPTVRAAISSPT